MDLLSPLGALLTIVLLGGFIAYQADKLGKKLGKKRLGVRYKRWNLRPKYVAALGTVLMGMVVSTLTIGFIALVSRDARVWLREGRGLLVQRDKLARDVKEQSGQLKRLTEEIEQDRPRLQNYQNLLRGKQQRVLVLDNEVKVLDGDLLAKNADLQKAKGELAIRQAALERLRAQLPGLKGQVALAKRQYESTNRLLTQAEASLTSAKLALVTVNKSLQNARSDANTFRLDADRAKKAGMETYKKSLELAKQITDLEDQAAKRTEEVEHLKAQTNDLIALRNDAEGRTAEAQAQYRIVAAQLDDASTQLALQRSFLDVTFKASRQEPLTFGASEELARVIVPSGATPDDAENAMTSLIRTARLSAEARGAKGHRIKGRTFDAADVFDRQDPKTGEAVSGEALKRAVVQRASGRGEEQVLVATSSLNAFRGEPVALDIAVVPNPMIYRRNETVAEAQIDGSLADDRILAQLSDFVAGKVRDRAERDHMIPRANTAAPFGEVPPGDVFGLVRDVKRAGHSVRVQAVAESDTRAADPLRLEFHVK